MGRLSIQFLLCTVVFLCCIHYILYSIASRIGVSPGASSPSLDCILLLADEQLIQYSIEHKEFRALEWSRTDRMEDCGVISTLNGRYVVRFGGYKYRDTFANSDFVDQITVFDIETQTVTESTIECPVPSCYRTISLGSDLQDETTMFGFVNRCYKSSSMRNVQTLPIDIIQMMSQWYCDERVHLFAVDRRVADGEDNNHWQVDLDEIIRLSSI